MLPGDIYSSAFRWFWLSSVQMDTAWDTSSSNSKWTSAMVKCLLAKAKDSSEFIKLPDDDVDEDEDDDDDFEDEEPEPEVASQCNNNQLEDVQGSLVTHEVVSPLVESLANMEVPYRCLYMSCVNFYSSKGQMLHHLKTEHGLEMHLVPVVVDTPSPNDQTVTGGAFMNSFSPVKRMQSASITTTNGQEEQRTIVLGQRSHVDHHLPPPPHGHVRHKCPYAQCFTCPHCFGCYSTRYRLNLHLKCSHREAQATTAMATATVAPLTNAFQVQSQFATQTREVRTTSPSPSSSSPLQPQSLVNLVKCNLQYSKVKRMPVK